jgi:hypothetical protein
VLLCSAERLKLEKDYLELQSKAFAAPGSALAEVKRNLVRARKLPPRDFDQLVGGHWPISMGCSDQPISRGFCEVFR